MGTHPIFESDFDCLTVILEKIPVHSYTVAMTCGGCSGAITRILTKKLDQEGEQFDVSLENKTVKVQTQRSADEIKEMIAKCGKETNFVSTDAEGSLHSRHA